MKGGEKSKTPLVSWRIFEAVNNTSLSSIAQGWIQTYGKGGGGGGGQK